MVINGCAVTHAYTHIHTRARKMYASASSLSRCTRAKCIPVTRGEVLHMHASIDMNASLHAKRLRAYLICHFPFGRERHSRGWRLRRRCGNSSCESPIIVRSAAYYPLTVQCAGSCLALYQFSGSCKILGPMR